MKTEQIHTLHPQPGKTNNRIALVKNNIIKDNILSILQNGELTHADLMEQLYDNVKDRFEGGVYWYGETVKPDSDVRKIIERTGTKPDKYRLQKREAINMRPVVQ